MAADFTNNKAIDNQTKSLSRKFMRILFIASIIVLLVTIIGISLVQTKYIFNEAKKNECLLRDSDFSNIVSDNYTHEVFATQGGIANLHCNVSVIQWGPEPCIIWRRNNYSIPRREGVKNAGLTLHFTGTRITDRGLYFCNLCSNKLCTEGIRTDFNLNVEKKPAPEDLHMDGPRNTTVVIGGTAFFFCHFNEEAPNRPQLTWWRVLHETGKIEEVPTSDRSGTNQSLFIQNVQKKDAGLYTCLIKTSTGSVASQTAELIVNDRWLSAKQLSTITLGAIASLAMLIIFANIIKIYYGRLERLKKEISKTHIEMTPTLVGVLSSKKLPLPKISEVSRQKISLGSRLGQGNFGCVYQAEVKDLFASGVTSIVAVKSLLTGSTNRDRMNLMREIEVMKIVGKHNNIVKLLGHCTARGDLMLILECVLNGSLDKYLKSFRYANDNDVTGQKSSEELCKLITKLLNFSWQIASGMEYLETKKCIHRDLAARNVLIDLSQTVKICDFGLARDISALDYYIEKDDEIVPYRFMAPESLAERKYYLQSDVWSYGVLCWEIFTLGYLPYPWAQKTEILQLLQDGYRLERPENCPLTIYEIMVDCWNSTASERPTFSNLVQRWSYLMTPEGLKSISLAN